MAHQGGQVPPPPATPAPVPASLLPTVPAAAPAAPPVQHAPMTPAPAVSAAAVAKPPPISLPLQSPPAAPNNGGTDASYFHMPSHDPTEIQTISSMTLDGSEMIDEQEI